MFDGVFIHKNYIELIFYNKNNKLKCFIDAEDFEKINKYNWHCQKDGNTYYARTVVNKKHYSMHRIIMKAQQGQIIDHINRNGLDNRKNNLRFCTIRENSLNRKINIRNKTGYTGISIDKQSGKYKVTFEKYRKSYHGGYFEKIEDAIKARKLLEAKYM